MKSIFLVLMSLCLVMSMSSTVSFGQDPKPRKRYTLDELFDFNTSEASDTSIGKKRVIRAHPNNLTFYPFALSASMLLLGYERSISQHWSLKGIAGYANSESNQMYSATNLSGFYLEVQPRYYFGRKGAQKSGLFAAPFGLFKSMQFNETVVNYVSRVVTLPGGGSYIVTDPIVSSYRVRREAAAAGVLIGYRVYTIGNICLDGYFGSGMLWPTTGGGRTYSLDTYARGTYAHLGFSLGFGF